MKTIILRTLSPVGVMALYLLFAAAATTSHAATIYDGFSYSGTALAGQNGGTGWSGAWTVTAATDNVLSNDGVSLSYPVSFESPATAPPTTGSRVTTGGLAANAIDHRLLSQTIPLNVTGTVKYVSALFRKNVANGGGVNNDNILLEFYDNANNRRWGVGIEGTNDSPWVNLNASGTGGTPVVPGDTYFMVAKIESFAAPTVDVAKLWVFGTGYASQVPLVEPISFDATASNNTGAILDRIRIRIDTGNTGVAVGEVDEIRISDTWLEAIGVPEPSSMTLLSVALLAGIFRRRRGR